MPLQHLTLNFASPAENLACDEAMLDFVDETDRHAGFIRFFESPVHFVVLGYGKKVAEETFEDRCAERGIPILRRCSGGGTVLQGPGCFNYALALPIDSLPGLDTITGANRAIMERNRRALQDLLRQPVEIQGITDLSLRGMKFSGNAQRRKRRALLFHGSFLLNFDLALVAELLREPAQQPEYRERRDHSSFIRNIGLRHELIREKLCNEWDVQSVADNDAIMKLTRELAAAKYSRGDWSKRL